MENSGGSPVPPSAELRETVQRIAFEAITKTVTLELAAADAAMGRLVNDFGEHLGEAFVSWCDLAYCTVTQAFRDPDRAKTMILAHCQGHTGWAIRMVKARVGMDEQAFIDGIQELNDMDGHVAYQHVHRLMTLCATLTATVAVVAATRARHDG